MPPPDSRAPPTEVAQQNIRTVAQLQRRTEEKRTLTAPTDLPAIADTLEREIGPDRD